MIRLAWRQFRVPALTAGLGLAVVAVALGITGPQLAHLYATTVATCPARGGCPAAAASLLGTDKFLQIALDVLVLVAPVLTGIFWGAPLLASELESGTFRLAWTQSITRTRWITGKLALAGLAAMTVSGLLSLLVTWWSSPVDLLSGNRFSSPLVFGARGVVPVGYAAFAFALGVAAGALLRRTLPAMAATLGIFAVARIAVTVLVRPRLISPLQRTFALNPDATGYGPSGLRPTPPSIPGGWVYSVSRIADHAGRPLTQQALRKDCPSLAQLHFGALHACVARVGAAYHGIETYQPASRYWLFQWSEAAIFLGAALILAGLCVWLVRRRT